MQGSFLSWLLLFNVKLPPFGVISVSGFSQVASFGVGYGFSAGIFGVVQNPERNYMERFR